MKIAHCIATLDPAAGGPPAVAMRLAAGQTMLGHGGMLLTHDPGDRRDVVEQAIAKVPNREALELQYLPHASGLGRATGAALRRALEPHLRSVDFLHLHGVWETILRSAAAAARRLGVPYAVRPAGMLDPWSLAQKKWKKRLALALGYRRMLNGAAFIHALNDDEAKLIEPLGLDTAIRVIPNGVFLGEIDPLPSPETFHADRPELNGEPYLLFLSRLHYKKGLDLLAEAYARFREAGGRSRLVVAGPEEGAGDDFRQRIDRAGVAEHVTMTGPLYGTEKLAAMVGARAFVLPTRQEGFSVAVTEALACGLPVVTTHDCHFPQIAEVEAGLLTTLDVGEIAEAMLAVDRDPERAAQWGRNGRQLIESRFTWDRIAAQTVQIITETRGAA